MPDQHNVATVELLPPAQRDAYDDARREYHAQLPLANTPTIQKVISTARQLVQLTRNQVSARRGLIVSGAFVTGKTTVLTHLGRTHERHTRVRHPRDRHRLRVIYVAAPPAATARMLAVEFARFRAEPHRTREHQREVIRAIGAWLGRTDYQPPEHGDAIAHWIKYDSWQPPSQPHITFPQTREHGSTRPATTQPNTRDRHDRSATWFAVNRRGGTVILHHRHIRPVLIRHGRDR